MYIHILKLVLEKIDVSCGFIRSITCSSTKNVQIETHSHGYYINFVQSLMYIVNILLRFNEIPYDVKTYAVFGMFFVRYKMHRKYHHRRCRSLIGLFHRFMAFSDHVRPQN